jgi:hypothetical protein
MLVRKVTETFQKVENGTIDFKDLKKIIHNDLHFKPNDDFNSVVGSANRDNKTYAIMMRSLGLLKETPKKHPPFSPDQIKESTEKKFHRYAKNKGIYNCRLFIFRGENKRI